MQGTDDHMECVEAEHERVLALACQERDGLQEALLRMQQERDAAMSSAAEAAVRYVMCKCLQFMQA